MGSWRQLYSVFRIPEPGSEPGMQDMLIHDVDRNAHGGCHGRQAAGSRAAWICSRRTIREMDVAGMSTYRYASGREGGEGARLIVRRESAG